MDKPKPNKWQKRKIGGCYTPPGEPIEVNFTRTLLPLELQIDPSVESENVLNAEVYFTLAFDENGNKVDCWSLVEKEQLKNKSE